MSKSTKLKLIKAYNKLLEEKHQLEREKAWLIKRIKGFTYGGMPMSQPSPYSWYSWSEAATLACLPEDKKKDIKIKSLLDLSDIDVILRRPENEERK